MRGKSFKSSASFICRYSLPHYSLWSLQWEIWSHSNEKSEVTWNDSTTHRKIQRSITAIWKVNTSESVLEEKLNTECWWSAGRRYAPVDCLRCRNGSRSWAQLPFRRLSLVSAPETTPLASQVKQQCEPSNMSRPNFHFPNWVSVLLG